MSEIQLFVIAALASAIVYGLKVAVQYLPLKWAEFLSSRGFLTVFLFAVAIGLALAWQFPVFAPFPVYDGEVAVYAGVLLTYLIACMEAVSPLVAFATLIYNALAKLVFDKLSEKYLSKKINKQLV